MEWAAEEAKLNSGQGFVPDYAEWLPDTLVPFLTPESLYWWASATKDANGVSQDWLTAFGHSPTWLQGLIDPADFILTDPLGRRFGYTATSGLIDEIPGVFYSGDGLLEQFLIVNPLEGLYEFELFGLGEDAMTALQTRFGQVTFQGFLSTGDSVVLSIRVVDVPEPSALWLLAVGVACVTMAGRWWLRLRG